MQMTLRDGSTMNHFLNDVIYNPDSPINICSILQMYNKAGFKLDMDSFSVRDKKGAEVATVYQEDGILILNTRKDSAFATIASGITPELLHRRMGHLGYRNLSQLTKVVEGITLSKEGHQKCECCSQAKLKKLPFGQRRRATRKGEIIHLDLVPKITPTGYDGSTGYLSITDDFTTRTRVCLLRTKDEATAYVKQYNAELKAQNVQIAAVYSDRDRVFTSNAFQAWMAEEGIKHEPTVHHTPEENGLAEIS